MGLKTGEKNGKGRTFARGRGEVLDPILGPGGHLPSAEWAGLDIVPTQGHVFISPHLPHPCGADLSRSCSGLLAV